MGPFQVTCGGHGQAHGGVANCGAELPRHELGARRNLTRLAEIIEAKLGELVPRGRPVPAQALLLAAMALAHDVEAERTQREALERRTRDVLRRVLVRIDDALEPLEATAAVRSE